MAQHNNQILPSINKFVENDNDNDNCESSDEDESDFGGGGAMMWDDDE